MTVRLGTNIESLKAQRSLGQSSDRLEKVYQRLSTGQRINRASDDAAGLAIADSLNSKSRVFTRGVQNVSDGLSALTIADSAVESLIQLTTRIQELAEQGANGSYSNRQREALDKEAQSLRNEFLRIVQSTSFNGQRLLDGTVQGLQIQAGYGTAGAIASSVGGKLGTGSFNDAQSLLLSANPSSVLTSDLNGDGIQDAVTLNEPVIGNSTISVLLGKGDGTFNNDLTISNSGTLSSLALSDMNGDGIQDIVTANTSTSQVSVRLGNGDGSFKAESSATVGTTPSSVAVADFNGDGIQDVVSASSVNHTVSVLLGNGNGTLRTQQTFAVGRTPTAVRAADLNKDGAPDLITFDSLDNTLSILIGNGNGTFQTRTAIGSTVGSSGVTVTDLNGDGNPDFIGSDGASGTIGVRFGNGNGTLNKATLYTLDAGYSPGAVSAADVNGDGFNDLVVQASFDDGFLTSGAIAVLLGAGDGTFGASSAKVLSNMYSLTTSDMNGDGVPDVVTTGFVGLSVSLNQTRDGVQPLLPISLKTQADSKQALSIVSQKLELLTTQRGVLGAAQSRLISGSRALASQRDEFIAANSRIRDTDFAGETAELTRTQIIQNAATAVMAQANQQPAIALRLLRL